jgi:hypothetical protein
MSTLATLTYPIDGIFVARSTIALGGAASPESEGMS